MDTIITVEVPAAFEVTVEDVGGPQGIQGPSGPTGPAGPPGPVGDAGEDGAEGPQGVAGPTGPVGPEGPIGPDGPTGPQGRTILYGTAAPTGGTGVDDDFYLRTTTNELYGPKNTTWPAPVSLIGPTGPTGATGATGAAGSNGTNGADGVVAVRNTEVFTGSVTAAGLSTDITLYPNYQILSVECDIADIRVRIYSDTTARTADAGRILGISPNTASGIFLEVVTINGTLHMAPVPNGYTTDETSTVPVRFDHSYGSTQSVTLTVKFLELMVM